jgi:hypothetical protein
MTPAAYYWAMVRPVRDGGQGLPVDLALFIMRRARKLGLFDINA